MKDWQKVQQSVVPSTKWVLSYSGFPTDTHAVRYAIARYSKLAGIHPIKVHALRHSHASLLISLGENALIIKDQLGHEDIETTLGTYGHLYPNSNREVAERLNGLVLFNSAKENKDFSPKNQFTVGYK